MGSHNTLSVDNPEKMAVTNGYGTGGSVGALNFTYIFMCALFIFLMQIGFAMLEVGMVSTKNTKNIMIKGVVDVMVGALAYFVCGFSFTYGAPDDDPSEFAGGSKYWFGDSLNDEMNWIEWFFQFCFAATAATIVSGAVAERCHLICYITYSIALTSFIYPIVAYWQWSGYGWASKDGAWDLAGSGLVHMTGGCAAIVGAAVIGPRKGRFEGPYGKGVKVNTMPQHSPVFVTLGTMILWLGWFGLNTGSTLSIAGDTDNSTQVAGLILVNTTLSPACCGLTCMLIGMITSKMKGKMVVSLEIALNGVLAGLVAITAGADSMPPGLAMLTGCCAAPILLGSSAFQKMLMIDDVVDAGPVHFWNGIWGVLAVGIFSDGKLGAPKGLFYGEGDLFGEQLKLVIVITLWVTLCSVVIFVPLKLLKLARVSSEVEEAGLDVSEHGAEAL